MTSFSPDSCRYFLTYSGVKLPLTLKEPLEPAAIANRNTYFRAWFDADERIVALEKMVYGEVEMAHRYRYGPGGTLIEAEISDAEGETTTLRFDPATQQVRSEG